MSNAIGLVAAGFSGTWGYRQERREARSVAKKLTWGSLLGGIIGATLLIKLPSIVFNYAAPTLIVFGILCSDLSHRHLQRILCRSPGHASEGHPGGIYDYGYSRPCQRHQDLFITCRQPDRRNRVGAVPLQSHRLDRGTVDRCLDGHRWLIGSSHRSSNQTHCITGCYCPRRHGGTGERGAALEQRITRPLLGVASPALGGKDASRAQNV